MGFNAYATLSAALIPMLLGFVYYHPKVFGAAWMSETGMTEEKAKSANMIKLVGFSLLFAVMLSIMMNMIVVHQYNVPGIFQVGSELPSADSEEGKYLADFMAKYGNRHRTFSHGVVHGIFAGLLIALPVLGTNALYELRSWKYIFINAGFWLICMALMGGVICAWV